MTVQNLQNLGLRAAFVAGVRTIRQESKALFTVMGGKPVETLSLPWQPLPERYPSRLGTESAEGHRNHLRDVLSPCGLSMDTLGRRAGRSAGSTAAPGGK